MIIIIVSSAQIFIPALQHEAIHIPSNTQMGIVCRIDAPNQKERIQLIR